MTKVSIIVPVYNVKNYLAACLDSLVSQHYTDYEIIAVNDGSTDGSLAIIESYQTKYPDLITIVSKENGGLSDARNVGILQSQSPYLCFVDSDDTVDPKYVSLLVETIEKEDSDIAVCDMEYVYDDGRTLFSSGGDFTVTSANEWPELLTVNNSACNKLFKRSLFDDTRFIKGIWYEDLATIPVLMVKAKRVVKVNRVLYHYLQRTSSIIHTQNRKVFDIYIALQSIHDQLNTLNQWTHFKKQVQRLYVKQGVELTNLRIKDYEGDHIEFYAKNHSLIQTHYPGWYWNPWVWNQGIKKWVAFTLFKYRFYRLLQTLYSKKA